MIKIKMINDDDDDDDDDDDIHLNQCFPYELVQY